MTGERYARSLPALSGDDLRILHGKRVFIAGMGGLGGYIAELLARIGVLEMTLADCGFFEQSNLNRQRFSTGDNLGVSKVLAAKQALCGINGGVRVHTVTDKLDKSNTAALLQGHDAAADALDNIADKLLLADACALSGVPLVHGAVGGWFGQVMTVLPGDDTLRLLYQSSDDTEPGDGALPFVVSGVAALQCAETVKLLTGRGELLRGMFLRLDVLTNEYTLIPL